MAAGTFARCCGCAVLLLPLTAPAQADTSAIGRIIADTAATMRTNTYFYGALSTSYAASENWGGLDLRHHAFSGNLLYRHTAAGSGRSHLHVAMADLGYLKFVDSTWVKHLDRLQVALLWSTAGRRVRRSWSAALSTQFLPTALLEYDLAEGRTRERAVGGFLNPFTLEAGHGVVWSFWEKSSIDLAFATVRLTASPKATTAPAFVDARTLEGDKAYYFLSYGFSFAALIDRPLGTRVQWLNSTRLFANGIDRDHVNLSFSNLVIVKLWTYLQLRLDTRLAYDPLVNYDLQFRQEVLLGFFYERTH
ncbi:MAG: hypothetical protein JST66_13255 [Bacteroidetes bacterium]|nr:hypothetical protein [Bacteroidota bacterium]